MRPRLFDRLDRLAALTVLQAPPGYGKSALASTWGRHRLELGDSVVWLTARGGHGSRDSLVTGLHDSIGRAGLIAPRHGASPGRPGSPWRDLADEIDRCAIERLVVIIDDGEGVDDEDSGELLEFLDRTPAAHLVVCSRSALEMAESAGRRQLDVARILTFELAFTATELERLAELEGWSGTPHQLERVLELCGGWPELSGRMLAESPTGALATTAEDYLRAMVLPHLSAQGLLDGALALSLAPIVTRAHLAALHNSTARSVSATPLGDRLRLEGILTPVPERSDAWSLVPLLRGVLREGAGTHLGDEVASYHRLFADALYDGTDDLDAVLDHARAGDHWALLSRLWEQHSLALFARHLPAAHRAYGALPPRATDQRPVLALAADCLAGGVGAAHVRVEAVGSNVDGAEHVDEFLTLTSSVLASQRRHGDLLGAAHTAETIAGELSLRAATGEHAHPSRVALFWLERSLASMFIGDPGEAIRASARAYEAARTPDGEFVAARAAGQLAMLQGVVGSPEEGGRWLEIARAIDLSGHPLESTATEPIRIMEAYSATNRFEADLADVFVAGGDALATDLWPFAALAATAHSHLFDDPHVALTRLQHLRLAHPGFLDRDGVAARIIDRCTVESLLALGETNRAEVMMRDIAARQDHTPGAALKGARPDLAWMRPSYAQLLLLTGDHTRAHRMAGSAWGGGLGVRDRLDMLMIQAISARRLGERQGAIEAFNRFRASAVRFEVFHAYVVVPESEIRELAAEAGTELPDVVESHLASHGPMFPERTRHIELTARELDVLRQMRHHATVAALGQTLHLSVNTVKKHLAAINSKLGVHDRRAALLEAERLGFFGSGLG